MLAIRRTSFDLVTALVLSAVLHTVAVSLVPIWAGGPGADALSAMFPAAGQDNPADEMDDLTTPVQLGIETSDNVTDTWIGFKDPTPHEADKAEVEQPALTLNPMAGDETPGGQPDAAEAAKPPAEETPAPDPELAEDPSPPVPEPSVAPAQAPEVETAELSEERLDAGVPAPPGATAPPPARPQAEPTTSEQDAPRPAVPPPGAGGRGDTPGEKSDKESIATALKQAISVRPGHPAAAQGLDIKTVRPRWRDGVRLTRFPRNPIIKVQFTRAGRVKKAEFMSAGGVVFDTGFPEVNEPLLNAVYAWTATGKALKDLPADKPDATLVLTFRILLVE